MGYSNITLYGSDTAADAYSWVNDDFTKSANRSVKRLRKELKDMGNEFNTSGPVNVAIILTESPAPLFFSSDYPGFLEEVIEALTKYTADSSKAEWEDRDNRKKHLSRYRDLLRKLRKLKSKIGTDDYDETGRYWVT